MTLLFFSVMSFMMRGQEVTSLRDSLPAAIKEDYRFRHGTGTHLVSPSQIRAVVSASGEADYIKYIQTLPGVSSGATIPTGSRWTGIRWTGSGGTI